MGRVIMAFLSQYMHVTGRWPASGLGDAMSTRPTPNVYLTSQLTKPLTLLKQFLLNSLQIRSGSCLFILL